jgi:cytochrome oxidase Cu insertion factor (SCO1/SenC/PrrC family)
MGGVRAGDDDLDGTVSQDTAQASGACEPLTMRSTIGSAVVVVLLLVIMPLAGACSADAEASPGGATRAEAWRTATLTDVLTGEDFRIADLRGKVVAIETMAIWCINCRVQQTAVVDALDELDSPDVIYVSLDVDPNERAGDLAEYARQFGFDWRFAIASPDVARSLAMTFGDQVLSPPSTPLIVLGRDGQVVERHLGGLDADDLVALFREHLS